MIKTDDHKTTVKHPDNRILEEGAKVSSNFFQSDIIFRHMLKRELSSSGMDYMLDKLERLGREVATEMDQLSLTADKQGPQLKKRNFYGETINEITFHPAYKEMGRIAVKSEMFRVKWLPELREKFESEIHRLGFASGYLFNLAEVGLYCPLCMTDGVARLIDRYCEDEDKQRLLEHIYTDDIEALYTGAMFLTEKAGGSDVGANLVSATHHADRYYLLNGEKWFCSNANAEIIFALARTNPEVKGTRGLSIFLIEKQKPDGSKNEMEVVRLKDKLGVRSMASAECILTDTWGKLVGEEGQGFKIMTDMINLSRLYNSISAIGTTRRALIEAYQFLKFRKSFGKRALDHALIREKLTELSALNLANFYITWRAIRALDNADNGDEKEANLLRLLTPMVKKCTAENCVYSIRESMELMGGVGYIEDGVLPKTLRDALVLPIWEGAGNIMTLDMLRASMKSTGFQVLCEEIQSQLVNSDEKDTLLAALEETVSLSKELIGKDPEIVESSAKPLFERLTLLAQIAAMMAYRDDESGQWIDPAISYLTKQLKPQALGLREPFSTELVEQMIGWCF
ncbi:MAG: acyl-CoA dehydrogenase family protein [Bacteroidota bacterium]